MVGFAIVGLGMGKHRARQVIETEGAQLVVVVDLNSRLAKEVAAEMGCDWSVDLTEILRREDVDVVLVMTPSGLHAKVGIEAVQAGKHVITTKPMDVSTVACDELIRAAEEAGVLLGVDYQSRYVDNNVRVATALRKGWLGRPILGEVRFKWFRSQEYFEHGNGWRGTWEMDGGGSLANQGAHLIDLLSWFMGDPVRVYGETAIMNHEIETEDIGLAILNFESGAKGTILGTTTFPESVYFSAEVHGSEGGVLVDEADKGSIRVFGEGLKERLQAIENPIQNVVEDVVSAIEKGTKLRVDGHEGRRTVALLEKIYESARKGMAVTI
ncbi:MAG: Glucose--fructose oxidoreductase [Candidatus Moanabacter tarae]|uniref:Glucose--fructose oxidoreductase n=1 Tax=Candidatus Moanibacter tarae TaxID=2200854 RepID=A0A2Z4AE11_9BACT|nr:MAG: Glucose--fructose oxidoreductase [Candidatus Moanabacter tarae]|tara:strand:- start:9679 stop:10656 length:978 start_codon:yes stop_codon:yes gene_type:complete